MTSGAFSLCGAGCEVSRGWWRYRGPSGAIGDHPEPSAAGSAPERPAQPPRVLRVGTPRDGAFPSPFSAGGSRPGLGPAVALSAAAAGPQPYSGARAGVSALEAEPGTAAARRRQSGWGRGAGTP